MTNKTVKAVSANTQTVEKAMPHKPKKVTVGKNTICLWYNKDAQDAAHFYAETFPTVQSLPSTMHQATIRAARKAMSFSISKDRAQLFHLSLFCPPRPENIARRENTPVPLITKPAAEVRPNICRPFTVDP